VINAGAAEKKAPSNIGICGVKEELKRRDVLSGATSSSVKRY